LRKPKSEMVPPSRSYSHSLDKFINNRYISSLYTVISRCPKAVQTYESPYRGRKEVYFWENFPKNLIAYRLNLKQSERDLYDKEPGSHSAQPINADCFYTISISAMDTDKLADKQQLFQALH